MLHIMSSGCHNFVGATVMKVEKVMKDANLRLFQRNLITLSRTREFLNFGVDYGYDNRYTDYYK
jgi:hypothetical protein